MATDDVTLGPERWNEEGGSRRSDAPRSVLRVLGILECVAQSPRGTTLTDLSNDLGAPKSSLLNLIRGLVSGGYLTLSKGVYTLGWESLILSSRLQAAVGSSALARMTLEWLRDKTDETIGICIATADDMGAYINRVESTQRIRTHIEIGERRVLYSSASGRAIIAFWPRDRLNAYLKKTKFAATTSAPHLSPERLRQILQQVAEEGYAVTLGEAEVGLGGVAAPVFRKDGLVLGSVVIAGPTSRVEPRIAEFAELLKTATATLSSLDPQQLRTAAD